MAKIEHYSKQSIKLRGIDEEIPVGRNYVAEIGTLLKDSFDRIAAKFK